jgi:iron complex outermembrane receptor protein
MRKTNFNFKMVMVFLGLICYHFVTAQEMRTVSGTVTDAASGDPLPGVSVVIKGTTQGTATNFNGEYSIEASSEDVLVFSFVGYFSKEVTVGNQSEINVQLEQDVVGLEEVVVIGYGQVKQEDATGSVTAVSSDDFNQGAISSPQELLTGKIAGVQITSGGGDPGAESTIRIRGGSSLTASNDPLIVIDGVPIDNEDISGMRNPLNTIHPSDIKTFTVLKDASATAIYGSRASNGVIIITTKKGKAGAPLNVDYNGFVSASSRFNEVDALSADEFRAAVQEQYAGNQDAVNLLGDANTNWQDEIYETAISHDHNLSVSGDLQNIPFRASIGYTDQGGILKGSQLERYTGGLNVNPSLLDDHLKINLNLKGMYIDNSFANKDAINTAVAFDPTKPVKDPDSPYGGFFTWTQANGDPITIATMNPVAQLELKEDISTVQRAIGNLQLDYQFHMIPELKANLNVGLDYSDSDGTIYVPEFAPWSYDAKDGGGEDKVYTQEKRNELLDFYLNYATDIDAISSRIDVMAGYSWQHFWRSSTDFSTNILETIINENTDEKVENYLVSFFARFNYTLMERYLLTATLRRDGSSRFSEDTRWGLFPAFAFAWRISDEPFMQNVGALNNLKLRLGYGVTGQQDIADDEYPYLARYTYSEDNARYQFGNQFIRTLRPEGYDANIKWEETTTYNAGLDYALANNRISGSVDLYYRKTDDLINKIPVSAGTNLTNEIITNVGDLENRGIEFSIAGIPISQADFFWEIGFNATYNENKITRLTATDDPNYLGVFTGDIEGGVGNQVQIHSVGEPSRSYFVYEQVYDEEGHPIEGVYVDRNDDGQITGDDRYHYKKATPDVFLGISSRLNYQNWDFSFAGRSNIGNYVYNNIASANGTYNLMYNPVGYLSNKHSNVLNTNFENARFFSDYYVQNASFFRMDHVTLGYRFNQLVQDLNMRVYATVQNVFVITEYKGLDPEINEGIDEETYPRPTTFLLGLNINF